ncbi:acyltransferase [Streptomyces sp. DSM 44917]|uniref:Acyltransferase n=1 Tax=Streptomyces boetiae TaxID=3075541 RepID=A0ABU2LB93_9ACTN|nr:acyltransferase [Streptomyces sp. DSM 44917]MDT0308845.1 acyltransferase [Streptomyces sp. DSM 44917]
MSEDRVLGVAAAPGPPPAAAGGARAGAGESGQPARLPSLTGLRFAAAGGVVCVHALVFQDPATSSPSGVTVWVGRNSVALFFVLSGYVMMRSRRPEDTTRRFWRRRAAKILPGHVLTWCSALVVTAAVGSSITQADSGALADTAALLLVHTWIPSAEYTSAGNTVCWSLAAEALFYLLFPVLARPVGRLTPRGCLAAAALSLAVLWTLPLLSELIVDPQTLQDPQQFDAYWFLAALPPTQLPLFLLGMVAARLSYAAPGLPRIGVLPAAALLVAAMTAGARWLPDAFLWSAATSLPLALLVHAVAGLDLRRRPSLLRARVPVLLGGISYALYLTHCHVLIVTHHLLGDRGWGTGPVLALALPLALGVAWLLYVTVERPGTRLLGRPRPRAGSVPRQR